MFVPLHSFLNVGVPSVLHATAFTAGPKSDKVSQCGKSGYLPHHGNMEGCLLTEYHDVLARDLMGAAAASAEISDSI